MTPLTVSSNVYHSRYERLFCGWKDAKKFTCEIFVYRMINPDWCMHNNVMAWAALASASSCPFSYLMTAKTHRLKKAPLKRAVK